MESVKMMQEKEERDGRSTLNTPVRDKVFLSRTGVFLWTFIGILPSDNHFIYKDCPTFDMTFLQVDSKVDEIVRINSLFSRLIEFLGETEERGKKIFKEWH